MATATDVHEALKGLSVKDLRLNLRARGLSPAGGFEALHQRLADDMLQTNDLTIRNEATMGMGKDNTDDYGLSANNYQRPGGNQNLGNRLTDRPSSRVLAPPGGVTQVTIGEPVHAPEPRKAHKLPSYMDHQTKDAVSEKAAERAALDELVRRAETATRNLTLKDMRINLRARNLSPAGGEDALRNRLVQNMIDTGDATVYDENGPLSGNPTVPSVMSTAAPSQAAAAAPAADKALAPGEIAGASSSESRLTNNYARPGGMQNVGNFLTDRPSSRVLAPPGGRSQITFG